MKKKILLTILIIFDLVFLCVVVPKIIRFDQNCEGRLERAANANSVELAIQELDNVIKYCIKHNYTSGYTSVIYKTPDEDITWWFSNLLACSNELHNLSLDATTLEKSNALMKLRESLTDSKGVIIPKGLLWYPHNLIWGILRIMFLVSIVLIFLDLRDIEFSLNFE